MQVATGTVVNGKIVLEGAPLTEGAVVAVVTRGADESFALTEEQENELLAAMAEIERGEYVALEELLQSLPAGKGLARERSDRGPLRRPLRCGWGHERLPPAAWEAASSTSCVLSPSSLACQSFRASFLSRQ